ncbi:DUF4436 family protein [Nocardia sp. NPDC051030]|uniref:DUF4436 family protein n=1 Tax=Nocardia sp. NPDC051030 TaxID=3155162 RepID=UPI00344052DF
MQNHSEKKSRGALWVVGAAIMLIVVMLASLAMYRLGRYHADAAHVFGKADTADRVDLEAWIGKIDTVSQTASVEVRVFPQGALADEQGYFKSDAVLYTSALKADPITLKAGQPISVSELRLALGGTLTDYPFDRYDVPLHFDLLSGGKPVPLATTVASGDSFFKVSVAAATDPVAAVDVTIRAKRSTPTLVFAVFIMILMLGLAVAAATAAFYVLRWRRGLLWPACSMMAALLFALVPLRNAVPGSPPIGSVIDFLSFFIAEGIISAALISSVVIGYRVEIAKERAEHIKKQATKNQLGPLDQGGNQHPAPIPVGATAPIPPRLGAPIPTGPGAPTPMGPGPNYPQPPASANPHGPVQRW